MTENIQEPGPKRDLMKLSALCGVIAPMFFGVMVALEEYIVPHYNWVTQHVSDLGIYSLYGSYAILQDANFCIFGGLVIAFSFGRLRQSLLGKWDVTVSLAFFGTMSILAGIFEGDPLSFTNIVHGIASLLLFFSITICQILVGIRLLGPSESGSWRLSGVYSIASAVVTFVLFPLPHNYPSLLGLIQRVSIAVPWLWIEVMALKLFRSQRNDLTVAQVFGQAMPKQGKMTPL